MSRPTATKREGQSNTEAKRRRYKAHCHPHQPLGLAVGNIRHAKDVELPDEVRRKFQAHG